MTGTTNIAARDSDAAAENERLKAALFAGILANDDIDETTPLPARIDWADGEIDFAACFALCLDVWNDAPDRLGLLAMARRIAAERSVPDDLRDPFKFARARYKHLRFGFAMFSTRHRSPLAYTVLTNAMGNLQDAYNNGLPVEMGKRARFLCQMLGTVPFALVRREIAGFKPDDAAGFARFRQRQLASIAGYLAKPRVTPHEFHNCRKVISRLRAYFNTVNTLYPSADRAAVAACLATLNGLMGNHHDDLIAGKLSGQINYYRDLIDIPPHMRQRLDAFVLAARG